MQGQDNLNTLIKRRAASAEQMAQLDTGHNATVYYPPLPSGNTEIDSFYSKGYIMRVAILGITDVDAMLAVIDPTQSRFIHNVQCIDLGEMKACYQPYGV